MIFSIHYFFITSGLCSMGVLLGVFLNEYSDASQFEIGCLYLIMPITVMFIRPMMCALADRTGAHKKFLLIYLWVFVIGYIPFVIIPFLGPAVYVDHSRACWYTLVVFKIIGDIGLGAILPLSDSLAINYAERIGADYCTYRKWGTISWGLFGIIIGQINEVWFLPKYVPGFLVLLASSLFEILIIWLWPDEFFVMVPKKDLNLKKKRNSVCENKEKPKNLMNWSQVLTHMKLKLLNSLSISSSKVKSFELQANQQQSTFAQAISNSTLHTLSNSNKHQLNNNNDNNNSVLSINHTKNLSNNITMFDNNNNNNNEKQQQHQKATINIEINNNNSLNNNNFKYTNNNTNSSHKPVSKRIQMQILARLVRKDPRIVMYLLILTLTGFAASLLSFFFIYMSKVCKSTGECNFSLLAGYLQSIPAAIETVYFMYITTLKESIGRMNLLVFSFVIQATRFSFYGYYFEFVSPWFSLISESFQGVAYGTYIVVLAEVAHEFANNVKYVLPDMINANEINPNEVDTAKILTVLPSTMQAIFSSAMDGVGRALGALLAGLITDKYSFTTLWQIVGNSAAAIAIIIFIGNFVSSKLVRWQPAFEKETTIHFVEIKSNSNNNNDNNNHCNSNKKDVAVIA